MVKKNTYYDVTFTDMSHDGMGVAKVDNYPLFVKDALKGEKALIKVVKANKNFGFGRLIEIKEASPFRKQPLCEHFHVCGGCNLMHMNYEMQGEFKQYRVKETLRKIGDIQVDVDSTKGMQNPYYYRNKAIIPFKGNKGKVVGGLYRPRSHEIVNIKRCHIFPKVFSEILRHLRAFFQNHSIPIYEEENHVGIIRAIMLRKSWTYDEISLTLITRTEDLPSKDALVKEMRHAFPNIVSIIQNINPQKTNRLLGDTAYTLYGGDAIRDKLLGLKYAISHQSFFQVNPVQTASLYKYALSLGKLKKTDVVVDAHAGIGTLTLPIAQNVSKAYGIEPVSQAVKDAGYNAKQNEIDNVEFIQGRSEEILENFTEGSVDCVYFDPPRKGCAKSLLNTVTSLNVPRIVYISCNISTMARDVNILVKHGYVPKKVIPFDMFPQTSHIETLMLLEKS